MYIMTKIPKFHRSNGKPNFLFSFPETCGFFWYSILCFLLCIGETGMEILTKNLDVIDGSSRCSKQESEESKYPIYSIKVVSSDQWLLHLLGTDVWHKIIRKRFSWKKGKILLIFVETVKNQTPNLSRFICCLNYCIIITNTQQKVYFA